MATRTFHVGDIISITSGKLVSPDHIGGVYRILNWLTGDDLMTHQLPRAMQECQGPLSEQFPDLAGVIVPSFKDGGDIKAAVMAWLDLVVAEFGETREVAPLDSGDHTYINPLAEIAMMRPNLPTIVVAVPESTEEPF